MPQDTIEIKMGVAQARLKAGDVGGWSNVWTHCVLINGHTVATFLYADDAKNYVEKWRKNNLQKRHHV